MLDEYEAALEAVHQAMRAVHRAVPEDKELLAGWRRLLDRLHHSEMGVCWLIMRTKDLQRDSTKPSSAT